LDKPGVEKIAADPPIFFQCGPGRCKGGPKFECEHGYRGALCAECSKGQFYWNGQCGTDCKDIEPQGVVTVFGILGVILVWIILNKSAGGIFECLDVGVSYMQIMSTIFTFNTQYGDHSSPYSDLVSICNIVNLNVDFVSPSCLISSGVWKYAYGYYILLLIPLIPWLISAALTGAALAWSRTLGQKQEVFGVHLGFMCANTEQVKNYGFACMKQSIPFLGVVYNNVCLLAFYAFSCFTLRDGTSVMTAAPLIVCWESDEHRAMVGISIVALIVYVFGLPAVTLATTTYARKKDMLRDLTTLKTVGLFYREYEPEYYWWDFAFLVRRFALCLCAVVFSQNPYAQSGIAVLVITTAMIMQFVCRPYWDKRVNSLDCLCCLSILLQCLASLYFSDPDFVSRSDAAALDTILVIVMSLCLSGTLALFVVVLVEMRFRSSAIRTMSKGIAELVLLMQKELTNKQAAFIRVLEDSLEEEGQVLKGDSVVRLPLLQKAVMAALHDGASTTWSPSPNAIGALLCVLKMVNGDDDVHSHFLSDKMRESVAGDDGVPISMLRAFVGQAAGSMSTPTRNAVSNRLAKAGPSVLGATLTVARNVSRRLTATVSETHTDAQSPPTKEYGWRQQKVVFVIKKICWEIGNSFSALEFRRWMKTHRDSETRLANMFNLSAWLAEVIPDHSSVGAYSNSAEAMLYKQTAQHVPNMIMMSAFGGPEIAETMRHFMGHFEMAEHALSKEDRAVLDSVHPKDQGPFLYWLTHKASDNQRQVLGSLLADLKQADYSKINASLQGSTWITGIGYNKAQAAIAES